MSFLVSADFMKKYSDRWEEMEQKYAMNEKEDEGTDHKYDIGEKDSIDEKNIIDDKTFGLND